MADDAGYIDDGGRVRWWSCCTGFRSAGRCGSISSRRSRDRIGVIAPDLRGHGESPAPEGVYTMDEMADDVVELLDRLEIDEPVVLGGLSMGDTWRCRSFAAPRAGPWPDADRHAGRGRHARGGQARAKPRHGLCSRQNHAAIIETMVPRLFGKTTLEQHPERVSTDAGGHGEDVAPGSGRGPAGHGHAGPTGGATWRRSTSRRSSWSARTT